MILEWIEYLRTPASAQAKQSGHLKESIALRARAARQAQSWKSHLENCHQSLEKVLADRHAPDSDRPRSVLIMGSGHLFDISPTLFDVKKNPEITTIYLVDLVHPLEIRAKAKTDSRIVLLEMDLSQKVDLPKVDLIISANLMSQLPRPSVQQAQLSGLTEDMEHKAQLESEVCAQHWSLLQAQCHRGSQVIFWTDIEKRFFDDQGSLIHRESSLGNFRIPISTRSWIWDIAPIPEISSKIGLQMRIASGYLRPK